MNEYEVNSKARKLYDEWTEYSTNDEVIWHELDIRQKNYWRRIAKQLLKAEA